MGKNNANTQIAIKNRKAEYQYFLLTSFTAGIVLTGTEIKSIRAGKANITDAYCSFVNGELWVHNMHISEYAAGSSVFFWAETQSTIANRNREMAILFIGLGFFSLTIGKRGCTHSSHPCGYKRCPLTPIPRLLLWGKTHRR